jgi:DNA-binding NarL/FixJ family response regulator
MIRIQQSVAENNGDTKILLLLHSLDGEFITRAIYLCIHRYLKNTSNPEVSLRAIRAINNDEVWAKRDILTRIIRRRRSSRKDNPVLTISKVTHSWNEIFKRLTRS